jgi:hypothetical protein
LLENFVKPNFLGVTDAMTPRSQPPPSISTAPLRSSTPAQGRKYVTGDTLTLADFALGAPLHYATQGASRSAVRRDPALARRPDDLAGVAEDDTAGRASGRRRGRRR